MSCNHLLHFESKDINQRSRRGRLLSPVTVGVESCIDEVLDHDWPTLASIRDSACSSSAEESRRSVRVRCRY
jgi:hypothetical protein